MGSRERNLGKRLAGLNRGDHVHEDGQIGSEGEVEAGKNNGTVETKATSRIGTQIHARIRVRKTLPKRTEAKTYAQAGVSGVEVEMVTEIVFTCQDTAGFMH